MKMVRHFLPILVAASLVARTASAQSTPAGSANGTVTDVSGAVLPGVAVTISGPALLGKQQSITNEKGQYRFPLLPPGDYQIVYELSGFATIERQGIRVGIGFNAEVNVKMEVASLKESVTVSGQSPVIDTQNTNVQNNFTADMMAAIPNARDIWSLIAEAPGMTVTRFDVGGSTAGTHTGSSPYGLSGQNPVAIDP